MKSEQCPPVLLFTYHSSLITGMKLVILGSKGMLGQALAEEFEDAEPALFDREELDITSVGAVFDFLGKLKPTHVINAAAYTNVDGAEEDSVFAHIVNGDAVGYLASLCSAIGATLVHYSTDYVFDGKNPRGYREDDIPGTPVNRYGESKLLGEQFLERFVSRATPYPLSFYLIRTSWLYGPYGKNFVGTMLEKGKGREGVPLRVVKDQRGKPTYTRDLARATRELLEGDSPSGIYHMTNDAPPEGISWYDFGRVIFEEARALDPAFDNALCRSCFSSEFPRPAARPRFSMLRNTKFPPLRPWREALQEYLREYFGKM